MSDYLVSLVFFTASYLSIFLIALFGGGLQSPFLAMIAVTTLASFISSLKHGRIFLGIGVLLFGLLLLDDIFNWVPDYEYTILQARYFAVFSYTLKSARNYQILLKSAFLNLNTL